MLTFFSGTCGVLCFLFQIQWHAYIFCLKAQGLDSTWFSFVICKVQGTVILHQVQTFTTGPWRQAVVYTRALLYLHSCDQWPCFGRKELYMLWPTTHWWCFLWIFTESFAWKNISPSWMHRKVWKHKHECSFCSNHQVPYTLSPGWKHWMVLLKRLYWGM